MATRIMLAVAVLSAPATVRADHHGMDMGEGGGDAATDAKPTFGASVSALAASFSPSQSNEMFYGGSYQGVIAAVSWDASWFGATAGWSYYRLDRNGEVGDGMGDLVVGAHATAVARDGLTAGGMMMVSVPTGNDAMGLGMGHAMAMPAAFASWRVDRVVLAGSFGYSRALVDAAGHVHGMAPLVEPMNMSELAWGASADVAIAGGARAGARLAGGVPVGDIPGTDRMIGGLHVAWGDRRVETSAELQLGLLGDPFNIRGVVSTALRF